jgi:oligopeptide transport system substrate-binding protein
MEGLMVARSCWLVAGIAGLLLVSACTNDPYPDTDRGKKVLYSSFTEPPKTLDPAVAYTTAEHVITGNVYDTLLEYHYLKRPYQLIPGLATAVPEPRQLEGGRQSYRFKIRPGILFHADPCFTLNGNARSSREVVAADFAFALARLADPAVNSPVFSSFADVLGFAAFSERLVEKRKDAAFAALPVHEQYRRAGGIEGVTTHGDHELEVVLAAPNAQILYWFAMPFTTPVAWEAVAYHDGKGGHPNFADHAVGTGPYLLAAYQKQYRFVLERNDSWYGTVPANAGAPGAVFPGGIDPEDVTEGRVDPSYAGRRMPFVDRINFSRERENIPRFNKFLQGYYDDGGIIKESFDAVIQGDRLSPEMNARGMRLDKTVEPSIRYIGFNMEDPILGAATGEPGRKLRQAMSLAIDVQQYLELFLNGRGVPAQTVLPPGLFGYDERYKNPFRQYDLVRARKLLAEAGYKDGIDTKTGRRLRLSFDTAATTAAANLQFEYLARAWRQLGLDVEVNATTYNQFQDKIRRGAYQIFVWGWVADFPDPENFLFLLECGNARSKSGGPNTANFCNGEFDRLYREMKDMPSNEARAALIRRMLAILEWERPWIELYHEEDYTLSHAWLINSKPMGISYPAYKYRDVDPVLRDRMQARWNAPVRWPVYVLVLAVICLTVPAIRTYYRERL